MIIGRQATVCDILGIAELLHCVRHQWGVAERYSAGNVHVIAQEREILKNIAGGWVFVSVENERIVGLINAVKIPVRYMNDRFMIAILEDVVREEYYDTWAAGAMFRRFKRALRAARAHGVECAIVGPSALSSIAWERHGTEMQITYRIDA